MISVASLENSKRLFKVSDWKDTELWYYDSPDRGLEIVPSSYHDFDCPAYDLSYLLDKLPERTNDIRDTVMLGRATDNKGWSIVYRDFVCIADTPVDTVCLLCIKLIETNILKKGVN